LHACLGHPYGLEGTLLALGLAILLDAAYPVHRGLLLRIHPVVVVYRVSRWAAPPGSSTLRGLLALTAGLAVALVPACLLLYVLRALAGFAGWVLGAGLVLKVSLGDKLLYDTVRGVARALEEGRLGEARRLVQGIVRRPVEGLDPGRVASAAIESLAENLVDAYVSPLLYTLLAGPLAGLLARTVNTVDGAIGFRDPEYLEAGRVPALVDTALNYVPARITALMMILSAPLAGASPHGAIRCLAMSRGATESPNHWPPMAAMAGALGIGLEKPGHYRICPGSPLPQALHVYRALRLAATTGSTTTITLGMAAAAIHTQPL